MRAMSSSDANASDKPASPRPPPAPRAVPGGARGFTASFMMLFGGIWGGVGLLLFVVFTAVGGPIWNDWILDSRGARADAQPYDVHATSSRKNRARVYEIDFRFTDAGGKVWSGSAGTTDGAVIAAAQKGTHVAVEYDPQDPTRTRLAGGSASFFGPLVIMPLLFFLAGSVVFVLGFVRSRGPIATYRDGDVTEGRVTSVEPTGARVNRRPVMRMRYEFQAPTGTALGEWKSADPAPVGAAIWVIYDPARPEVNLPAKV
jgi:hypothetical protein